MDGCKYLRRKSNGTYKHYKLAMAIEEYGWDSFESVILESIETDDNEYINQREKFFIKEKDSFNNGYNMTEGGDGIIMIGEKNPFYGRKYTDEEKKKISEATKKAMQNPEIRKHISESLKGEKHHNYGKKRSEETKRKLSESCKGKDRSPKKVFMYDENNNLLREFSSLCEVERELGFNRTSVADCCKGKRNLTFGYNWRFEKI